MNSIKTHIDSKQFTDLFDQRYIKSLDEIRKSGAYPRYTINILFLQKSLLLRL